MRSGNLPEAVKLYDYIEKETDLDPNIESSFSTLSGNIGMIRICYSFYLRRLKGYALLSFQAVSDFDNNISLVIMDVVAHFLTIASLI